MRFFSSASALLALATTTLASPTQLESRAVKSLVQSNQLRRVLLRSNLLAKAQHLEDIAYATPGRNRLIGTQGHNDTITWIKDTIAQFPDYYTLELQPFEILMGETASLTLDGVETEAFATVLAPGGSANAAVVPVAVLGCDPADFPANTAGKIALIYRGTCVSGQKVANAAAAGALAVVIYNNDVGNLEGYSLQRLPTDAAPFVPTLGISNADGLAILARLNAGEEVIADLTTTAAVKTTYNIIAQTLAGDQENVIHISGHSDSVAAGPGINDNGSGTISILEIAIQLTNFTVNNAVRFSWWAAEEQGLLGATYYVSTLAQSELDKIRLMLDFDMMASPNYAIQIYDGDGSAFGESGPPGSGEAEIEFQRYFTEEARLNWTQIEFDGRSDYGPFLEAGIATGGIAGGAEGIKTVEEEAMFGGVAGVAYDINYHQAGDNYDNLNVGCWIQMSKAIAHMTATFARSFELLPDGEETRRLRREVGNAIRERRELGLGKVSRRV